MVISDPAAIFYLTGKWIIPGERFHALYINLKDNDHFIINKLFPQNEDLGVPITYYDDVEDGCGNSYLEGYPELWNKELWMEELFALREHDE